jgi:hypothetical protein
VSLSSKADGVKSMVTFSKISASLRPLLFQGSKETQNPPIIGLCRIYCVLAICAALLISACFYVNSWLWKEIARAEVFGSGFYVSTNLLNWLGLLMMAGAIIYGFKIARQATLDARKNARLLQETKQRTMEIGALYATLQHVSEKHELRALLRTRGARSFFLTGSTMILRLPWKLESECR